MTIIEDCGDDNMAQVVSFVSQSTTKRRNSSKIIQLSWCVEVDCISLGVYFVFSTKYQYLSNQYYEKDYFN